VSKTEVIDLPSKKPKTEVINLPPKEPKTEVINLPPKEPKTEYIDLPPKKSKTEYIDLPPKKSKTEGRSVKSRAHKNFLEWFFEPDLVIPDDIWFDTSMWPAIIKYASAKNGYHCERRTWSEIRWSNG
jgi:hypothetical protein